MYYRVMTSPPGCGPNERYMVGMYGTLDMESWTHYLDELNGRPYFPTLEDARAALPGDARRLPFEPRYQLLELWTDSEFE